MKNGTKPLGPEQDIMVYAGDSREMPDGNLKAIAMRARQRAEDGLKRKLRGPVHIMTYHDRRAFRNHIGRPVDGIAAVAVTREQKIVILNRAWSGLTLPDQLNLLTHEMSHLLVGQYVRSPIPDWLNEGLAMITAGEIITQNGWRISLAGTLGTLIPLSGLEHGMIDSGYAKPLAYAQSLSITQFYLQRSYPDEPHFRQRAARILADLSDPLRGKILSDRLWDHRFRHALEKQWQNQHSRLWDLLAAISGGSTVMAAGSLLLGLAYWRQRRLRRLKLEKFGEDDEFGPHPHSREDPDEPVR